MARVVRPRPLNNDERIPIYWPGSEPSAELKAIDGGALYRYLLAGTPKGTKRRTGERYRAPREVGIPFKVRTCGGLRCTTWL